MIRAALPLALALLLFAPAAAEASERPRVAVRLQSLDLPAAKGDPLRFSVRVEAGESVAITDLELPRLDSPGTRISSTSSLGSLFMAKGQSRVLDFVVEGDADHLVVPIRMRANGGLVEKSFDFSKANRERHGRPFGLTRSEHVPVRSTGIDLALPEPAPFVPRREGRREVRMAPATPAPNSVQRSIRVSGSLNYRRDDNAVLGADGVTVRVYDEDIDWDELVGSFVTSSDGSFDVTLNFDESEPDIYLEFETASSAVDVEDASMWEWNYMLRSGVFEDFTGSHAAFGGLLPTDDTPHGALHIHTNVVRAWRWWKNNRGQTPSHLDVMWPDGSWPHYDGDIHMPTVVDGRDYTWQSGTHIHEYGHHLSYVYFLARASSNYDNDWCDRNDGDEGHCVWCEETGATAVNEGWPNWYSDYVTRGYPDHYGHAARGRRQVEALDDCVDAFSGAPCACDPMRTEGFLQTLLRDIEDDTPGEDDPLAPGTSTDRMNLTADDVIDVFTNVATTQTSHFLTNFRALHPEVSETDWWHTRNNAGFAIPDNELPSLPGQFWAPNHSTQNASPDRTIDVQWETGHDALSGLKGYLLYVGTTLRAPRWGDQFQGPNDLTWATPPVAPGASYYVAIAAVDNEDNVGTQFRWVGPYPIRSPFPPDLQADTPAGNGWYRPLVARDTDDANATVVSPTASLPGNATGTYLNVYGRNTGEQSASGTTYKLMLDGKTLDSVAVGHTVSPGQGVARINLGPFASRGGRHAVEVLWDADEDISEFDEDDNLYTTQYVWTPLVMGNINSYVRLAPPPRDAGRRTMDPTQSFYWNCDGLRLKHRPNVISPMSSWWSAAAMYNVEALGDFDLQIHPASDLSGVGFAVLAGSSRRDVGLLDAVFSNRRAHTSDAWDVGVINADSSHGSYRIRLVQSSSIAIGDSVESQVAPNNMLLLRELNLGAGDGGRIVVTLQVLSGPERVYGMRFASTFETGGIDDWVQKVSSDDDGLLRLEFDAPSNTIIPLAFYRNPSSSSPDSTVRYRLQVRKKFPDLVASAPTSWHGPIVPRPASGLFPFGVPAPSSLTGETGPTYLNFTYANAQDVPTGALFNTRLRHDLTVLETRLHVGMDANERFTYLNEGPHTLPGGRHVLSLSLDPGFAVDEENEGDNLWGEQWVWSPDSLALGQARWRAGTNGRSNAQWGTIPTGEPLYPNADGVRTSWPPQPTRWFGVAVSPRAGSDVDVQLHEVSTGPKDGFDDVLAGSGWGAGTVDYVLVDQARTLRRRLDVGITRASADTASYVVESSPARLLSPPFGPHTGTIETGRVLDVLEFDLTAGTIYRFDLTQTSHTVVDWGMALHGLDGSAFWSRSRGDSLASSWSAPPGGAEGFVFTAPASGRYALAVWKNDPTDVSDPGSYRVDVTGGAVDAPPAAALRTGLAFASPNPWRQGTTLHFDLAEPGEVALEVYDLRGARVRTLARGAHVPGRHSAAWDGRDEGGTALPAGIYLARLVAHGRVSTLKLARMAGE